MPTKRECLNETFFRKTMENNCQVMYKKAVYTIFFVFTLFTIYAGESFAQVDGGFTTDKTSKDPTEHRHDRDFKRKKLLAWIKNDTQGTLTGNRCFEEVTKKMGFEYVVQPRGNPLNKSDFSRFANNFGVKMGIFFRNGPFWKFKLKKERKRCRKQMGDFTG